MKEIKNELSWSVSRSQLFQSCPRAYYYNYYGYWGGWQEGCDQETRLTYILRNIKTLPIWAGGIVHEIIKEALVAFQATGQRPMLPNLQKNARDKMNAGWLEYKNKEWLKSPKKTNIFELYYGDGENYGECITFQPEVAAAIKERVMTCLDAFCSSPTVKAILDNIPCRQWKPVDQLVSFMIDDIKVWAAVDFAYEDNNGILHIIDWKTGSENKQTLRQQLACYAFMATKVWNASLDNIALHGVFLQDGGRCSEYQLDQQLLNSVSSQIKASYNSMKSRLKDPDNNVAEKDAFPPLYSEFNCSHCPFRQICLNGQ